MRRLLVAGGVVLLVIGVVSARYLVWPDLRPLPRSVDAIVELGGPGDRDGVALRLARSGIARYVVQSTTVEDAASDKCLPHIPNVTVLCFHPDPSTTRGEAQAIARLAQQYQWRSVVVVTSTDQALRARLRVTRCFSGDVYSSTTPPPALEWFYLIPYQWSAFVKAWLFETEC